MKKILMIKFAGLGDIVMLFLVAKKLKIKYPNSKITLFCDEINSKIVENCDDIDDVFYVNRDCFRKKKILKVLSQIWKMTKFVFTKKYDLVLDFQNFGETALMVKYLKAKEKFGAQKKHKRAKNYTKTLEKKYEDYPHRVQYYCAIADVDTDIFFPKIKLTQKSITYKNILQKKLDKNKKVVGLNIGSTQEYRRYSEFNFLKLGEKLQDSYNIVVFLGKKEERFLHIFEDKFFIVNNVDLNELCGAISLCDYFISNDTGPVHIAAALEIPTLTLFSTGDDENVGALNCLKENIKKDNINDIIIEEIYEKFIILQKKQIAK